MHTYNLNLKKGTTQSKFKKAHLHFRFKKGKPIFEMLTGEAYSDGHSVPRPLSSHWRSLQISFSQG